jgi:uncharacterized Tic20 family protein
LYEDAAHVPSQPESVSADDRTWAAAAHLSAFLGLIIQFPGMNVLGPLVIWLARRDDSAHVDDQGLKALNFQITMAILWIATFPLVFILIGIPLFWAISIVNVIFVLVAGIQAASGKAYTYPFTMDLVKPRDDLR